MNTLRRYLFMAKTFFVINVQCGLEYPAYLLGWLISNPLQCVFGIVTVKVVVDNFHTFAGWDFHQLAFMYGLGVVSHGLSVVLFVQTWGMDSMATSGGYDRMMLRPLNVFFQLCFMYFNFIGFTDMIPGVMIFIYGCVTTGFQPTLLNLFNLLLVLTGATLIRGGIYTLNGALSFWVKRTAQLVGVYMQLFNYTEQYPLQIFPKILQWLFTFIFPIGFISFYPAGSFLHKAAPFSLRGDLCLWTLLIGLFIYFLSMAVFQRGLRRYESSGS